MGPGVSDGYRPLNRDMNQYQGEIPKLIIIGLDGGTFDLIRPWVTEGKLPAFERMIKEGTTGQLRSTIQPHTAPAWVSFMTGMNPGKHGIYDFVKRKPGTYDVELVYAGSLRYKTIWTHLSEGGKSVGAMNVPMTYPPRPVNGFLISGIDTPGLGSPFTYPTDLRDELRTNTGEYVIAVSGNSLDEWAEGFRSMVESRTRAFEYLRHHKTWDCLMVVYSATDMSQHLFWKHMHRLASSTPTIEDKKYGGVILDTYQRIDAELGRLLDEVPESTTIMIMSDHGAGPLKRVVFINKWLEEQGWLVPRKMARRSSPSRLATRLRRGMLMKGLFLAKKYLPQRTRGWLKRSLPGVRDSIEGYMLSSALDWSKTKAFSLGSYGSIYLNLRGREPEGIVSPGSEAEELCNQIITRLEQLRDPETGDAVVDKVHRKEELYSGDHLDEAPDLIVQWRNYEYDCRQRYGSEETSVFGDKITIHDLQEQPISGVHRLSGIFLLRGNHVAKNREIEGASILDLAPTALYLLGVPIPRTMDGQVLPAAFEEGYVSSHPPIYVDDETGETDGLLSAKTGYTDQEARAVQDRLKGLGYLQ
jgi:predicted AlkP superfamily phosphohydrolase/phosphomutase